MMFQKSEKGRSRADLSKSALRKRFGVKKFGRPRDLANFSTLDGAEQPTNLSDGLGFAREPVLRCHRTRQDNADLALKLSASAEAVVPWVSPVGICFR